MYPALAWCPYVHSAKVQDQMCFHKDLGDKHHSLVFMYTSSVSPLTCDLIQRVLNIPSLFVIDDIKIRALLNSASLTHSATDTQPFYLKAGV